MNYQFDEEGAYCRVCGQFPCKCQKKQSAVLFSGKAKDLMTPAITAAFMKLTREVELLEAVDFQEHKN